MRRPCCRLASQSHPRRRKGAARRRGALVLIGLLVIVAFVVVFVVVVDGLRHAQPIAPHAERVPASAAPLVASAPSDVTEERDVVRAVRAAARDAPQLPLTAAAARVAAAVVVAAVAVVVVVVCSEPEARAAAVVAAAAARRRARPRRRAVRLDEVAIGGYIALVKAPNPDARATSSLSVRLGEVAGTVTRVVQTPNPVVPRRY